MGKVSIYIRWLFILVLFFTTLSFTNKTMKKQDSNLYKINVDYNQSLFRFITDDIIVDYLGGLEIVSEDSLLKSISYIESTLNHHSSVKNAEVYSDISGNVVINIIQRTPIIRVKNSRFKNGFYIDKRGKIMDSSEDYSANVLVATGNIDLKDTIDLFKLAAFINEDDFWSEHIVEIKVTDNKEIELVIGFGSHIVEIGDLYDLENKLDNLFIFYRDALPTMGWDRYKNINLKYKNQIVCTKKQVAYGTK